MPPRGNNPPPKNNKPVVADSIFVMDATGSQQPYIDNARDFVDRNTMGLTGDRRYRLIIFRDHIEQGKHKTFEPFPWTTSTATLKSQMATIRAFGGGDGPEAQLDALDFAFNLRTSGFRADAKKSVTLITDSAPHGVGERGDVVPKSHDGRIDRDTVFDLLFKSDIIFNFVGCFPELDKYPKGKAYYERLRKAPKLTGASLAINKAVSSGKAIMAASFHAIDTHRIAERWEDWIIDESHRGRDAVAADMHAHLIREEEHVHDFRCGHDTDVTPRIISRAKVDEIVDGTLDAYTGAGSSTGGGGSELDGFI